MSEADKKEFHLLSPYSRNDMVFECPSCNGMLWLNTSFSGLPCYMIDKDGVCDKPFRCFWCNSILTISNYSPVIIEKNTENNKIKSNDIVLIKESMLWKNIYDALKIISVEKNGNIEIGGIFRSQESFAMWCSNVASCMTVNNKIFPVPVRSV